MIKLHHIDHYYYKESMLIFMQIIFLNYYNIVFCKPDRLKIVLVDSEQVFCYFGGSCVFSVLGAEADVIVKVTLGSTQCKQIEKSPANLTILCGPPLPTSGFAYIYLLAYDSAGIAVAKNGFPIFMKPAPMIQKIVPNPLYLYAEKMITFYGKNLTSLHSPYIKYGEDNNNQACSIINNDLVNCPLSVSQNSYKLPVSIPFKLFSHQTIIPNDRFSSQLYLSAYEEPTFTKVIKRGEYLEVEATSEILDVPSPRIMCSIPDNRESINYYCFGRKRGRKRSGCKVADDIGEGSGYTCKVQLKGKEKQLGALEFGAPLGPEENMTDPILPAAVQRPGKSSWIFKFLAVFGLGLLFGVALVVVNNRAQENLNAAKALEEGGIGGGNLTKAKTLVSNTEQNKGMPPASNVDSKTLSKSRFISKTLSQSKLISKTLSQPKLISQTLSQPKITSKTLSQVKTTPVISVASKTKLIQLSVKSKVKITPKIATKTIEIEAKLAKIGKIAKNI